MEHMNTQMQSNFDKIQQIHRKTDKFGKNEAKTDVKFRSKVRVETYTIDRSLVPLEKQRGGLEFSDHFLRRYSTLKIRQN